MLKDPFEINATFFVPSRPKQQYRGVLTNSPECGISLEIQDLNRREYESFPLLCGTKETKPFAFTLINVVGSSDTFSGGYNLIVKTTRYKVGRCLFGQHYKVEEELLFKGIRITYSNFREWVNQPSVFTEFGDEYITKFVKLPDINGSLDSRFDYSIKRINSGSYPVEGFDINVSQNVSFDVIGKNGAMFEMDAFLNIGNTVKKFLMFMQDAYVSEKSIVCIGEKEPPMHLVQFFPEYATPKKKDKWDFPITYSQINKELEVLLQKWIVAYREMPKFFDAFFENKINDTLSSADRFENLIQSLFYYHNYKFGDVVMPSEQYNKFVDEMKTKLNEQEKEFVERFRNIGNQYSVSKQIKRVFEQMEHFKDGAPKPYIKNIVKIRNSLSHSRIEQETDQIDSMVCDLENTIRSLIKTEIGINVSDNYSRFQKFLQDRKSV